MQDVEQLALMEAPDGPPPPPPEQTGVLERHGRHVRVIPAWTQLGWVVAWHVPRKMVRRPLPMNYHPLGHPPERDAVAGTGEWWHEDPVERITDAVRRVEECDGDWRRADLPGVFITEAEAKYGRTGR